MAAGQKHLSDEKLKSYLFTAAILLIGCALRLSFGDDIEYKADEAYNFNLGQTVGTTSPWAWVGMNSSAGILNPGMSLWIFVFLTKLFAVRTPPELARAVQICNCLALGALVFIALSIKSKWERKTWLWGSAIAAVNPISVALQRKIWAPSVLPIFSILFILNFKHRDRTIPAFLWGLIGAILGQVHMGGFFYAAAAAAWTRLFDKTAKVKWLPWALGSAIGALPLVPWMIATTHSLSRDPSYFKWIRLIMFKFWNYWIVGALGTNISYSIGENLYELMKYPMIGQHPTYIVGIAQSALCVSFFVLMAGLLAHWVKNNFKFDKYIIGDESETDFLVNSAFWGMGTLITIAAVAVQNQYLLVTFPLQFIWLSRGALRFGKKGEFLIVAIFISQCIISSNFLYFIHKNGGAPNCDYGVAYSRQQH